METHGTTTASDGRLLQTRRGGLIQDTGYGEKSGPKPDLGPRRPRSRRPHWPSVQTCVTRQYPWLSSGVEPQLVAKRAGHSVGVLLRAHAKFLSDGDEAANAKISARLGYSA